MGNFYMESTQINYRRDEKTKTVDQKLQELSETSAIDTDIAPVFKSTNTYHPGDMVYYRNKLYVFNVEHTGTWAAADVTATDVTTEISSLKSGLINLHNGYYRVNVTGAGEDKWYKIAEHTATTWNINVSIIAIPSGAIKRLTLRYDQGAATFNNDITNIESVFGSVGKLAYKYSSNKVEVFWKAQRYGINTYTVLSESGNTAVAFQTPVLTEYVDSDMDYIESST